MLGLLQETYKMNLAHLDMPESTRVIEDIT